MLPYPWSVPALPFSRTVRPNSLTVTTVTLTPRSPRSVKNAASAPASSVSIRFIWLPGAEDAAFDARHRANLLTLWDGGRGPISTAMSQTLQTTTTLGACLKGRVPTTDGSAF